MTRHYLRGYVLRAAEAKEGGALRIVAATAGRKGDGLNLTMDGADLARFQSNPVVGYGHQYWGREGLPIGRSDKTWIDDDKLMMEIVFDQEDEFARTVERKYRGGYLNAFSIGFDVWDIDDSGTPRGWELFEVSAVPLPMDPDAVVESGRELELTRALGLHPSAVLSTSEVLRAGDILRAGAVLSKKNKGLVENAVAALQELLDSAAKDEATDDDAGRSLALVVPPAPAAPVPAFDPVSAARRRRLAGI
ncbi:HK97 family phage prohead protease [Streptomyces virginiae]